MITVCFVHAHAKRNCGNDDLAFVVLPLLLNTLFVVLGHPSVEVFSIDTKLFQILGYLLSFCAGNTIYDPSLAWVIRLDKRDDATFCVSFLGDNLVAQIGAIERLREENVVS